MIELAEFIRDNHGRYPNCESCEKWQELNRIPVNCQEECTRPILLEGNNEAMQVFNLCRNQLIVSPMGDIVGIRLEAVKVAMDLLGIEDQLVTLDKVIVFNEILYKKD